MIAHVESSIRQITVCGQEFRVAVRPGTGDRRPLLLCNGIGASLELFEPFVAALDPKLEVITFDVPGIGGSPGPKLPYTFLTLASALGKVLDSLGYDEIDVLGISWGGALAQQFAFQNPKRCRRLVLVATATGAIMVPARPNVLLKMANQRRYKDPAYASSIAGEIYGGRLRDQPELVAQLLTRRAKGGSKYGYEFQLLAGLGWTSVPFLPLLRQPTLILAGDDDPIIPLANARLLHSLIRGSRLHVYPDGHLGLMTMRDELAGVVGDFLKDA